MRWLSVLKNRLFPGKQEPHPSETEGGEQPLDYHPAHEGETPDDLHRGRHRLKETYTNHWDLDYLPREELEEELSKNRKDKE